MISIKLWFGRFIAHPALNVEKTEHLPFHPPMGCYDQYRLRGTKKYLCEIGEQAAANRKEGRKPSLPGRTVALAVPAVVSTTSLRQKVDRRPRSLRSEYGANQVYRTTPSLLV